MGNKKNTVRRHKRPTKAQMGSIYKARAQMEVLTLKPPADTGQGCPMSPLRLEKLNTPQRPKIRRENGLTVSIYDVIDFFCATARRY